MESGDSRAQGGPALRTPGNDAPVPRDSFIRALPVLVCVWVAAVAIRFYSPLARGLRGGSVADWTWAVVWATICVLVVLASAYLPPAWKVYAWVIPLFAAVVLLWLSGMWVSALLALWLTLLCAGIGVGVMRILLRGACTPDEAFVCGIPLGMAVMSLAVLAFGLLGWLTAVTVWLFLAIISVWSLASSWRALLWWGKSVRTRWVQRTADAETTLVRALLACFALANLLWALAPEVQFDALNYHLVIPKTYLEQGRIVELPFLQGYFVHLVELFLSICMVAGGEAVAKFWIFLMSSVAVLSVFALGRAVVNRRTGLWAAALFATTPLVGWLSGTVDIDNLVALFVAASLLALVRWEQCRQNGWLYLAALLSGVAIGAKVNAVFAYVLVGPLVLLHLFWDQKASVQQKLRAFAGALAGAALFALPTYALVYGFTGNPIFPLLNGIFKSPKWDFDNAIVNAAQYGLPMTAASLLRFPFRLTFDTSRFGDGLPAGELGLSLLLAFPFAIGLMFKGQRAVRLLLLAATGYVLLLFATMQYARFYIAVLPVVAVLGAATLLELTPASVEQYIHVFLVTVVCAQPLLHSLQFWNIPERFPLSLAVGRESRESFRTRALPGYAAASYLNKVSGPQDRILGEGTENLRFYLRPPLETLGVSLRDSASRGLTGLTPGKDLLTAIQRAGFTRLFITRTATKNPPVWLPYLDRNFLETHGVLEFADDYALVYGFR